jgi:hypothetical protein
VTSVISRVRQPCETTEYRSSLNNSVCGRAADLPLVNPKHGVYARLPDHASKGERAETAICEHDIAGCHCPVHTHWAARGRVSAPAQSRSAAASQCRHETASSTVRQGRRNQGPARRADQKPAATLACLACLARSSWRRTTPIVVTGSGCLVRHQYPIDRPAATIAIASKAFLSSCLLGRLWIKRSIAGCAARRPWKTSAFPPGDRVDCLQSRQVQGRLFPRAVSRTACSILTDIEEVLVMDVVLQPPSGLGVFLRAPGGPGCQLRSHHTRGSNAQRTYGSLRAIRARDHSINTNVHLTRL